YFCRRNGSQTVAGHLADQVSAPILHPDHDPEHQMNIPVFRLVEFTGIECGGHERPIRLRIGTRRFIERRNGGCSLFADQDTIPQRKVTGGIPWNEIEARMDAVWVAAWILHWHQAVVVNARLQREHIACLSLFQLGTLARRNTARDEEATHKVEDVQP